MDRYITTYETFSLWQITEMSSLPSVARFVLEENYKHHKGKVGTGVLLAEADERLLHVMRALRIDARALAAGKEYICSMMIPIMVSQEGLRYFMLKHLGLFSSLRLELGIRNYPFG